MGDAVQVEGADRLRATLARLARDLQSLAPKKVVSIIGRVAQQRAPKRTGRLAASFSGQTGPGEQLLRFGAAYAAPIHFGVGPRTGMRGPHNIRPNPYLFGAVDETHAEWERAYTDEIKDMARQVKGA